MSHVGVSRADVESQFMRLLSGETSREEVDRWVAAQLARDVTVTDAAVRTAIERLHGVDLRHGACLPYLHSEEPALVDIRPAMRAVPSTDGSPGQLAAWSSSDDELTEALWRKFSETAKALFSVLIDNPGTKFNGDELGRLLDLPAGKQSVAGVLGWPGRHCQAAGRPWLWAWDYAEGENARYWMTDEVADLFRPARARWGGRPQEERLSP
ncbi:DUF6416 domain-containing protein [Lentzea sp.]|uniref:DUF6416 domain-containing protein n=1 Tax=Lentzea sp. TaxID=56099 RepID=UPI002ECFC47C